MKNDPVEDYILKNERNLRVAAAVSEAWLAARGKLISGFLDRLDARLKRQLKGWKSEHNGADFIVAAYPGYWLWKPAWEDQYTVGLQCHEYGERMVMGVTREINHIGKRPFNEKLLSVIKPVHSSAKSHQWWEARVTLREPAPDWRKPEVLWRMHKDDAFLVAVADQLLEIARTSERIIDGMARKDWKKK